MTQVTSRRDPLTQRFARTVQQTVTHGYDWWQAHEPQHIAGVRHRPVRTRSPWPVRLFWRVIFFFAGPR